jgi:mRNA-degrading endonuclease RelE of RelBE toxin-antitoxin system
VWTLVRNILRTKVHTTNNFCYVNRPDLILQAIINLKKLKGDDNAYQLRIGDYRIGFYFDGETVTFARVLHRKDIYRYFPP